MKEERNDRIYVNIYFNCVPLFGYYTKNEISLGIHLLNFFKL